MGRNFRVSGPVQSSVYREVISPCAKIVRIVHAMKWTPSPMPWYGGHVLQNAPIGFFFNCPKETYRKMAQISDDQLATVVQQYEAALAQSKHDDASDVLGLDEVANLRTRCIAGIVRLSGTDSIYHKTARDIVDRKDHEWNFLKREVGVAKALLHDIENGYLKTLEEMIHGDVFSDYLEMADHLLEHKFKDAAAVLVGSTLEVHIKMLCGKHGIDALRNGRPRTADQLNAELAKLGAYSKLDQKSVTAWFGLRNNAAHGHYSAYTGDQVRLLLASVRDFITRHPA